jgi:alpha-ketoglutarate-dependent taurine dioxygenase
MNRFSLPKEKIQSARAWDKGTDLGKVVHTFSNKTQAEVTEFVKMAVPEGPLTAERISQVVYDASVTPRLQAEVESIRDQVDNGIGFVVFPAWEGMDVHQSRVASWLVDNAFGECRVQDDKGTRLIEIFNKDDGLSMKTGARYHDTREGNSPHTDGPQVLEDPDYLCLRCVNDALIGGENILVTADSMYNWMLDNAPGVLETLGNDFIFHARGVPQVDGRAYFKKPVFEMDEVGLRMRFLDHYMKGGHKIADQPMTPDQSHALYVVNSLFEQSDLQFKARLAPGQQVVFANKRMLHARTEFADRSPATEVYDHASLANLSSANRLMDRTWTYKSA